MSSTVTVFCGPDDLRQGLFGKVALWVFEILPFLAENDLFPRWEIRSKLYGEAPDFIVVPGVFDLAYAAPEPTGGRRSLLDLHARHGRILGADWPSLSRLWRRYFTVPARIVAEADRCGPMETTLGVHYRGTDKNLAAWDTNPMSQADFVTIILDFLAREGAGITRIFVASDEGDFAESLARRSGIEILTFGPVPSHYEVLPRGQNALKADRALLDCLVLSRCRAVLQTSSALSSFAKILRPDLDLRRCSASKIFTDRPYFPTAYVPPYTSADATVTAILERSMAGDWLTALEKPKGPRA